MRDHLRRPRQPHRLSALPLSRPVNAHQAALLTSTSIGEFIWGAQPLAAAFSLVPGWIFTDLVAGTDTGSPVLGLRPMRALRST